MMAMITENESGRKYYEADVEHTEVSNSASPGWHPDFAVSTNPQYMGVSRYGITQFSDLFTERQIVALSTFCELIEDVHNQIYISAHETGLSPEKANEYATSVCTYLSFAVDKCADYWTVIATWMPRGTVGHAFSRQAVGMTWDFPEALPHDLRQ
jgi:putative DNA methylase